MSSTFSLYMQVLPQMLKALVVTLQISVITIALGSLLGGILGLFNSKRLGKQPWSFLINCYVAVLRGTPLFVQVLIVYFALPSITGWDLSPLQAGIVALTFNSAAYIAELIRGATNALPKGQWEACKVLGYDTKQSLYHVIVPQVLWAAAPALVNEMISLIKESSILMVVGVPELTKISKDLVASTLKPMELYLLCALLYFIMTTSLQLIAQLVERRQPWHA